ncbi:MAG TPA: NAD(+)/NADH kinase [Acidimicrobiia bacterium]|nr:NAD(+)/NADH kinase [Acidimicrobiia bacterium]
MTPNRPISTIGLVPHRDRPVAQDLARRAAAWLQGHGLTVRVCAEDVEAGSLDDLVCGREEFAAGLDVAVSLGGDGTMLRTVDLVYESGAAVLGVNVGQLGYLTEVEPADLDRALERLVAGEFEVDERMVLDVTVGSHGSAGGRWWALNETVIEKSPGGRVVRLDVAINGTPFTTYVADGVIAATPTGSTAYSFSARGPIVSPRHRCLLLTPVSPHMLFDRSLVLDADEEVRFTVTDARTAVLTLDGRELGMLDVGDTVTCTGGPKPARIVTFGPRDFHQILKAKFGLADR